MVIEMQLCGVLREKGEPRIIRGGHGSTERVLVDGEPQPTLPDRTRCFGIAEMPPRVLVDFFRFIEALRFGRTFLAEPDRQIDVGAHLEKLALPVLEERFEKMA